MCVASLCRCVRCAPEATGVRWFWFGISRGERWVVSSQVRPARQNRSAHNTVPLDSTYRDALVDTRCLAVLCVETSICPFALLVSGCRVTHLRKLRPSLLAAWWRLERLRGDVGLIQVI